MKKAAWGFTLVEAMMAFVLLGLVSSGILQAISESLKYRARVETKARILGLESRVLQLLNNRTYVQEILATRPENSQLKKCLRHFACDTSTQILSAPDITTEPGLPPISLGFRALTDPSAGDPSFISFELTILTDDPLLQPYRRITALHDLSESPPEPYPERPLPRLECPPHKVMTGVKFHPWEALCR